MGKRENQQRWYEKNKATHIANVARRRKDIRRANRAKIEEYFESHPCIDCGITEIVVLTFDHVRGKKRMEVSLLVASGYSWETILDEISKCVVRCWNCHMRVTAQRRKKKFALVA